MDRFTEEELSGLSDEERAAVTGADEEVDDAILEGIAGDSTDDDDTDADDGDADDGEAADEDDTDAEAGTAATDEGTVDVSTETEQAAPEVEEVVTVGDLEIPATLPPVHFVPRFDGEVLPQFEGPLNALDEKYQAGDINLPQYNRERDRITAQMNNQKLEGQLWDAECMTFYRHNERWRDDVNPILWGAMNQEVMRILNGKEGEGLSGIQVLYAARNRVAKALGIDTTGAPSVRNETTSRKELKPSEKQTAETKPAAKRPNLKTLGGLPTADANETGNDEFASLDSMDGLDLEQALTRLEKSDPAKYQRYLAGR